MSPLRESFGEEWVDMDEEETTVRGKGEELPVEAKGDRNGGYKTSRKDIDEEGECMLPALIEPSQVRAACGFERKEEKTLHFQSKKEKLFVEMEFEISASACGSKENVLEEDVLEMKLGKQCLKDSNEIYLELECLKHEYNLQEKIEPPREPSLGRASGEGKRLPRMKRVMSEASFMRGQVMMSEREVVQLVMSKRESSKAYKEGTLNNKTWGKTEAEMRDYRENDEGMVEDDGRDMGGNMKENGSTELVVATRQAPSVACEMPLDAIRTCSSTLKEVHMHQITALEAVCTPPKISKHTSIHPISKGFTSLEEILLQSAHSEGKKVGSRRLKTLEVVHMGEESQGEAVGKQYLASGGQGQLEVKEGECECCGMREECSIGYIEHVKAMFSGHWVCGLCAEAVHEERHRLGKGVPMEEAVRTHMHLCKQFSSKKKVGEPPQENIGVAHAVCHLFSRHLSSPSTSPRQQAGSPARPLLTRTSSCLPSFSAHKNPCTT